MTARLPAPAADAAFDVDPGNARAAAAGLVARWLATDEFPERLVESATTDRAFLMETVYGIVRRRRSLDWALAAWVRRPPPLPLQACLYVGAYQLLFLDRVPAHAAVHATVAAAKHAAGTRAAGFVNQALRRVAESAGDLRARLAAQPLGIRESMPDLLVNRWTRQFGAPATAALCAWQNERPAVILRIDRRRMTLADYQARLVAAGIAATPHPFRPDRCLTLPPGTSVATLPGYAEGAFVIQDPATLLAVERLAPQPGDRVLDACAAPGGKALLIAEALGDRGELVALDLYPDRLVTLRENLARLKAPATVVAGDARDPDLAAHLGDRPFDRILVDVPCTNTGVLRRRPDARWRFSARQLAAQTTLQRAILDNLYRLLKPGGTLVYSTCSLEPEENSQLVKPWAARLADAKFIGKDLLFPPETQTDGAFVAVLRKKR